jgi:hypothetical protein
MTCMENKVLSEDPNYAIVRLPGRSFPGCVIQGDSLAILVNDARVLLEHARSFGALESIEIAEDVFDSLSNRLDHYEHVLKAHDLGLPYVKRSQ